MMVQRSCIPAVLTSIIFALVVSTSTADEKICHAKVDLVFILDASGSVGLSNFEMMKNFTKNLLKSADIDNDYVRVGVNVFSSRNKVVFNLNTYDNKSDVFDAIDAVPYEGGSTFLQEALDTVRTEMFTEVNGDRDDVQNVAIVVTDGVSQGNPIQSADEAKNENIHIFAIGIGSNLDTVQLEGIAYKPADMYLIENFTALKAIESNVFETVCVQVKAKKTGPKLVDPKPEVKTKTVGPYPPVCNGEKFYYADTENKCFYWQCDAHGIIFHKPCPYYSVWDESALTCVRPADGIYECDGAYPPTPPTRKPWTTPEPEPTAAYPPGPYPPVCDGTRHYYPDIESPCKFFQCDNHGHLYHMPCPYGLIWNTTDKDCVNPPEEEKNICKVCDQDEVDLVLVLDFSESIGVKQFAQVKNYVKNFLKPADIDGGKVRVGIEVFSTFNEVAFNLNNFTSKADIFKAINTLQYIGQGTYTASALKTMRDMFTVANGDRPNVGNVALVITDGASYDNAVPEANAARADGIHIYAIGVGRMADTAELEAIANKPSMKNVFKVNNYRSLKNLKNEVYAAVCDKSDD